jgi:uncharacterized membrane protein (DUF4010 family)
MSLEAVFARLGIALGVGMLVGLQREFAASRLAGIRTFPLVTLLGSLCALLSQQAGGWVLVGGFLALAALVVAGYVGQLREDADDLGLTTEVAALVMFGVGAFLILGTPAVAVAVGAATAILLYLKRTLHEFAGKLGEADIRAMMQFALVSLIILPLLPDRAYGPYQVLNPRQAWLMVVLIVGISLGGYLAQKLAGARLGTVLGGVLGGLVSSTATTVSYSRRTARSPAAGPAAALVIMLASTIVFVRVLIEIAVVTPANLGELAPPLVALFSVSLVLSAMLWHRGRNERYEVPESENPAELKAAIFFGLLYSAVLFGAAAAKQHFGEAGLYVLAVPSGLTDLDAITLSTAQLVKGGRIDTDTGWRVIVVASMANLVFKAGTVALLGHRLLLRRIGLLYAVLMAVSGLLIWLWP